MRARWAFVVSLLLLLPCPAQAESAPVACVYTTPDATPPAGSIPANQPVFHLGIYGAAVRWSQITLTRVGDGHVVPLVFWENETWGERPSFSAMETLEVGATYVLQHPDCPPATSGRTTTYTVVDPIAGPSDLGTVSLQGPFVSTFGLHGVCHEVVFYALDLVPDPAFAAEPWSSFEWTPEVDGSSPPRWSSVATTRLPMAVDCSAPGPHRVRASAFPVLPTGRIDWAPFRTPEVDVTFSCTDPTWADPITLAPLSPAAIAGWEADPMGTCTMDGGVPSPIDAAVDGGAHTEPDTRPNCSCSVGRRAPPLGLLWLALVAWCGRRARR